MTTTLKSIIGKTTLAPADGGPKLVLSTGSPGKTVLQSAVFGPQGVSITNVVVRDDGHLIVTLSNGSHIDAGVTAATYTNPMLPVRVWQLGDVLGGRMSTALDGVATVAGDGKSVSITIDSAHSPAFGLIASSQTMNSGKVYVAARITYSSGVGVSAGIGFIGVGQDENNLFTPSHHIAFMTGSTFGGADIALGFDTAILASDAFTNNGIMLAGADLDVNPRTWTGSGNNGQLYPDLQNEVGVSSGIVGFPTDDISIGIFIVMFYSGVTTGTCTITLLTAEDLLDAGYPVPVGYDNRVG